MTRPFLPVPSELDRAAYRPTPGPHHDLPDRPPCETRRIEIPEGHPIHLTMGCDPAQPDRTPRSSLATGSSIAGKGKEALFSLIIGEQER